MNYKKIYDQLVEIDCWMINRDANRQKIETALQMFEIKKHKNNSKARFSLVDLTEALILWRSGLVQQTYLADLYGVARNSVTNALETEDRWAEVKSKINEIEEICFGAGYNCPSQ